MQRGVGCRCHASFLCSRFRVPFCDERRWYEGETRHKLSAAFPRPGVDSCPGESDSLLGAYSGRNPGCFPARARVARPVNRAVFSLFAVKRDSRLVKFPSLSLAVVERNAGMKSRCRHRGAVRVGGPFGRAIGCSPPAAGRAAAPAQTPTEAARGSSADEIRFRRGPKRRNRAVDAGGGSIKRCAQAWHGFRVHAVEAGRKDGGDADCGFAMRPCATSSRSAVETAEPTTYVNRPRRGARQSLVCV